uniref:hypothetical protein n=1 Tax=Streptomyces sp. MSC1_001 TaxID=2909263 RepID=UPI0035B12C42
MHGWVNGVRSWLSSLDEDALRSLLTWHHCLRGDKHAHASDRPPSPPSRRELHAARVRLAKAQQGQLTSIAACGLVWAVKALHTEYGFSHRALTDPTFDELHAMLSVLDPPLARCALYGMLLPGTSRLPVGPLATRHEAALQTAADSSPPPDAHEIGPRLESASDDDGSCEVGAEAEAEAEADVGAEAGAGAEAGFGSGGSAGAGAEGGPGPSPASVAGPPTTNPECEDAAPVSGPPPLAALPASLDLLKRSGARLAVVLRGAADAVEAGLLPEDAPGDGLAHWTRERERLAAALAAEGVTWGSGLGYADAGAELNRLREARAEQADALRRKAGRYAELLEWADDEEEAADLRRHLERTEALLRELDLPVREEPAAPAPEPEPGSVSPADQVSHDQDLAPAPDTAPAPD